MGKAISKTGRRVQRPLTATRKRAFLDELRRHGIAAESARVASPHSRARHGAASTFRQERQRDPQFAADWDAAVEEADARLLMEAHRRAVEGTERGIFQRGTQATTAEGKPATEVQYSDRLMELLLKARFPNEFIERRAVEHSGSVGQDIRVLSITPGDLIVLNPVQRDHLRGILTSIADARGESQELPVVTSENPVAALPAPKEVEVS